MIFEEFAEQLRLNSMELGIQCVIFNCTIFSSGHKNTGWYNYSGLNLHKPLAHAAELDLTIEVSKTLWAVGEGRVP